MQPVGALLRLGRRDSKGGDEMQLAVQSEVATLARTSEYGAELEVYMAAQQPGLLRPAYLLTGDRRTAENLVRTALAKLYLHWDELQWRELVAGLVRRIFLNEQDSLWRRAWKREEVATDELPEHNWVIDRSHDSRTPRCGTSRSRCRGSSAR